MPRFCFSIARWTVAASLLLGVGADLVADPATDPVQAPAQREESLAFEVLSELRGSPLEDAHRASERLHEIGPDVIRYLLETLKRGHLAKPGRKANRKSPLKAVQRTAVLSALGAFGRDSVLPHWNSCFEPKSNSPRVPAVTRAALTALGSFGTFRDMEVVWHLVGAQGDPRDHASGKQLHACLENATATIMTRDHRTFGHLEHTWTRLHSDWWDEVIRAVGASRDPAGLSLLGSMLRMAPEHQRLVASQIPLLGPSDDAYVNSLVVQELTRQLESDSKADVQTASLAIGTLEQFDVVDKLIEQLSDERPGVAQSAHRALCMLTNKSISASPQIWRNWYRQELAWERDGRDAALEELFSSSSATVRSALREVSRHRLHRHALAEEVVAVLHAPDESNRLLATHVLSDLGSRWAAAGLVEALGDRSEAVRAAAHQALLHVTGEDRGPSLEDWKDFHAPGVSH